MVTATDEQSATASVSVVVTEPTFIHLASDVGDFIGLGQAYRYTKADAQITVAAVGGHLSLRIDGDENWFADFQVPSRLARFEPGTYDGLQRYPFHDPARGGLSWSGEGRGCNTLTGSFSVDAVTYVGSTLTAIDLRFEQHCEGGAPALRGEIHWDSTETIPPPGPVAPPPGLWRPAVGFTPPSGSYVRLESEAGDFIGAGRSFTYTMADSVISFTATSNLLSLEITGDQNWFGDFQGMSGLAQLPVGYYGNLRRWPFHNPMRGGLSWSGEGRGCNTLTGWFVIDAITYSSNTVTALDLRFEQHCEGGAPALHGQIHWDATDATSPPGPVVPPPAGLWQPGTGFTPPVGTYVHLESDPGDFIGGGSTFTYTKADALISLSAPGNLVAVSVTGDQDWSGDFKGMNGLAQLQVGYYADLERFPFHNPTRGGLDWSGEGRGCNTLTGWFVVDAITYSSSTVTALDLRFEQHCEGGTPALHGQIHWDATDTTSPPGPVVPPPPGLWQPGTGFTPPVGTYVHLESDLGDYVGGGSTFTYTKADALISLSAPGNLVSVSVTGDQDWNGDFKGMNGLAQLQVGYYGDLERFPFQNPMRGGLDWSGEGRGCNTLTGWFVVDAITYSSSTVTALDLRFEQHCEGVAPALHGKIHFDATDGTSPPGPISPPAGLWQPFPAFTPPAGSYVHLESDSGDFVGDGGTFTYTNADAQLSVATGTGLFSLTVFGDQNWFAHFQAMTGIDELQPGYYGNLGRYPFHNPARGGLDWSGEGRGCNTLTGWFVIDGVTYSSGTLTALDLRFEQRCDGGAGALHGKIHWDKSDTTTPPGPVNPPPPDLWQPGAGFTPPDGNYVRLESDSGDFVGAGGKFTYTAAQFSVSTAGNRLSVNVSTTNDFWSGDFQGMVSIAQLQPGYYAELHRYPFHNPTRGGLDWFGQGRGCNTLTGWFVVDGITYVNGTLTAVDLRFEQHCEGVAPALHGKIHWGS